MAYSDLDIEERSKQPAYVVLEDVKARNERNLELYTEEEIQRGQALYNTVSDAYFRSRVFLNFRERSIAVKVEAPKRADKVSIPVQRLLRGCEEMGVKVKEGRASIIFHIPRSEDNG